MNLALVLCSITISTESRYISQRLPVRDKHCLMIEFSRIEGMDKCFTCLSIKRRL